MAIITRRDFLKHSLALSGSACCAAALGRLGPRIAWAQSPDAFTGKSIVVVHQNGGCDWHESFCIPGGSSSHRSAYQNVRPASAVPTSVVLDLPGGSGDGLHPAFGIGQSGNPANNGLYKLFLDGNVRIQRRVGDPANHNGSHGTMQLAFETGGLSSGNLGWMGKVGDVLKQQGASVSKFMAMAVKDGNPVDIQGKNYRGLGVADVPGYSLDDQINNNDQEFREYTARNILNDLEAITPMAGSAHEGQKNMYDAIDEIKAAAASFTGRAQSNDPTADAYSNSTPGPALRQIAMLIQAGLPVSLAVCSQGGYDLHSNISTSQATLLTRLNQSVTAFMKDMQAFGKFNNVTLCIDSEFGRQLFNNDSNGTDHGRSIAFCAVGGAVNGGISGSVVTGSQYSASVGGSSQDRWIVPNHHFANIYEEALAWAGLPSTGVFDPDHPIEDLNFF